MVFKTLNPLLRLAIDFGASLTVDALHHTGFRQGIGAHQIPAPNRNCCENGLSMHCLRLFRVSVERRTGNSPRPCHACGCLGSIKVGPSRTLFFAAGHSSLIGPSAKVPSHLHLCRQISRNTRSCRRSELCESTAVQ